MNEQTSGHLRQLLQGLSMLAAAFGWLNAEQIAAIAKVMQDVAGPLAMIAGPAGVLGGYVWSWWVNRPAALVASVDAMAKDPNSPVKGVVLENTIAGRDMAKEMPGTTTAVAGSVDAKAIASTTG